MKPILRCLFWLCLSIEVANAQTNVQNIIALFAQQSSVEWAVPIPNQPLTLVQWQARTSSFDKKELRTFVGYYENTLIGTLSLDTHSVSGNLTWAGKDYQLATTANGKLSVKELTGNHDCGVTHLPTESPTARKPITQPEYYNALYRTPDTYILTDGVFRHFRLALVIDYYKFSSDFHNSVDEVKKFWANTEAFLNELYPRDAGVRFQVIDDEALIFKDKEHPLYKPRTSGDHICTYGTITLNEHYDKKKYDLAVNITNMTEGYNGLHR
ncbi:hypothetical protein RCZ04_00890 [Capnocytophaga sp. HP1101]